MIQPRSKSKSAFHRDGRAKAHVQHDEVESVKRQQDVQEALHEATGRKKTVRVRDPKDKATIAAYIAAAVIAFAVLFWAQLTDWLPGHYSALVQKLARVVFMIALILLVKKLICVLLVNRIQDTASRYNLNRVIRLLTVLVLAFVTISILFANWYAAFASLGLLSLILGFALQTPITSLIGWVYILARHPYRVGDRIKIGNSTGDVIEVGYLDTVLWEFGGEYLSTDHPSGRLIKFPNSNVLTTAVYNYSWPLFPYIWNEIKFQIAYQSDLNFIAEIMQSTVEEELGGEMLERVKVFRELLGKTPVNELDVRERPSVFFRVSDNTWLEAIVRYLVEPREAGRVKNALIPKMLAQLNQAPERVMFPKADAR